VKEKYEDFLVKSHSLKEDNEKNFSLESTTIKFKDILKSIIINSVKPTKTKLVLPELKKIEE